MAQFHLRADAGLDTPPQVAIASKPARYIVIHHTAGKNAPWTWDGPRWKALERSEQAAGYASLAYSFGVNNGDAHIQEIRGWGIRNAATGGTAPNGYAWNATSYAIVIDGYFHPDVNDVPSDAAIEAAADIIVLGVYLGYVAPDFEVWTHTDASRGTKYATACPGNSLIPRVNGFASIADIARYKLNTAPQTPSAPVPAPSAPAPPRCVRIASRRTLRRGDSGPSVKVLQNALIGRGYNVGAVDGQFGPKTEQQVKCFQQGAGLSADGIVGPQTWAALGH